MAVSVSCPCGTVIQVAPEVIGTVIECANCQAVFTAAADPAVVAPAPAKDAGRVPCPYCAEPIMPEAKRCPFCKSALTQATGKHCEKCGRTYGAGAKRCAKCNLPLPDSIVSRPKPKRAKRRIVGPPVDDGVLSAGDWIVCVIFPCIAIIIGFFSLFTGRPSRGGKMMGIGFLVAVVFIAIRIATRKSLSADSP